MSYVPEVTARWKRRADEIAEAIGDELNVTGTVTVINDLTLTTATITALATAITTVLNPTDIAAAMYALTMPVSVVSTNTTPVHVQVRNIAGGFTAMGSDISTSMKLTSQPVSIADTVHVDTLVGSSVAITGNVNLNVGSATVPISNPNNITVPVVNSNSVAVPVSLGSVTVPVKATAAGIPQNANGISLYLPVDANHGLTIPVGGGVTSIPVANTNNVTVPVAVGSVVVPAANTNNVTIPVTASGTVLDVNIKTVEASAKTQFHEAVETALEDAEGITVNQNPTLLYGVCEGWSGNYMRVRSDDDGQVYNANTIRISGTSPEQDVASYANSGFSAAQKYQLRGLRVSSTYTDALTYPRNWRTINSYPGGFAVSTPFKGYVADAGSGTSGWKIRADDGVVHTSQVLFHEGVQLNASTSSVHHAFYGHRVNKLNDFGNNFWFTEVVEV